MKQIIYHKRKSFNLPETEEELSGKQLIGIAGLLHDRYISVLKASLQALRILSGMSWWKFIRLSPEVKLNSLPHIQWIFDKLSITINLIPEYKGFYGPSEELNNLTLAEFHFAERYYAEITDDDYTSLPYLIAVLYRLPKKGYNKKLDVDGDIRQKFNSNTLDYYSNRIENWPAPVKNAILMFYDSCREKISNDYEDLFSGGGEDDGLGMYGIMRGLAGDKFGNIQQVEEMLLHNALTELTIIGDEAKELEAKYKQ